LSILVNVQRVLQRYAEGATCLSFSQVAAQLALPKSSASRLLSHMHAYGLLEQDATTRRYRLGALVVQAVRASVPATPLDDACRTVLTKLSSASGYTAYLSTLVNQETVVLQRLNGSHPMQVLAPPGARRMASGTAMGRAMLSRLPQSAFDRHYGAVGSAPIPYEGPGTPRTRDDLAARVEQARRARCAVAIDEAMPGIGAVAAAVRDPLSDEVRGLCVSFVSGQHSVEDIERLRQLLVDEVGALGRRIGDTYWQIPPTDNDHSASVSQPVFTS